MSETKNRNVSDTASGKKSMKWVFWLLAAKVLFILLLAGLTIWIIYAVRAANTDGNQANHFERVLGAGYSNDGKTLWLGTEKKLLFYKKGTWHAEKLKDDEHATAFLPINSGFIQQNMDRSLHWKTLNQERLISNSVKRDHRVLAVGYATGRLYNLRQSGSSQILLFSDDGGKKWKNKSLDHLTGTVQALAAAPKNKQLLSIGTTNGLYVSEDNGVHFQHYLKGYSVTCVSYGFSKQTSLLAGTTGKETELYQILPDQKKTINLDMGTVESDNLIQIAQNPVKFGEAAMLTKHGDIYLTENGGQNWTILAKKGRALNGR